MPTSRLAGPELRAAPHPRLVDELQGEPFHRSALCLRVPWAAITRLECGARLKPTPPPAHRPRSGTAVMETREQLLQALEWEALLASPRLAPLHLHPGPPKPAGRPFAENQQPPPPDALCPVSPRRSCSLGLPLASIDELEPLLCDAPVPAMPAMAGAQVREAPADGMCLRLACRTCVPSWAPGAGRRQGVRRGSGAIIDWERRAGQAPALPIDSHCATKPDASRPDRRRAPQAAHMVRSIAKLRPGGALTPSDNTCMLGKDAAGGCYPALQRAGSAGAPPQLPPLPPIKTGRAHSAPDALPALQGLKKIRTPRRHFGTAC